jgi:hypothetical protein
MKELILRFLIGGTLVSAFALIGDLLRPKSFAGLFGAAPSVALASLALTIETEGKGFTVVVCTAHMEFAVIVSLNRHCRLSFPREPIKTYAFVTLRSRTVILDRFPRIPVSRTK